MVICQHDHDIALGIQPCFFLEENGRCGTFWACPTSKPKSHRADGHLRIPQTVHGAGAAHHAVKWSHKAHHGSKLAKPPPAKCCELDFPWDAMPPIFPCSLHAGGGSDSDSVGIWPIWRTDIAKKSYLWQDTNFSSIFLANKKIMSTPHSEPPWIPGVFEWEGSF